MPQMKVKIQIPKAYKPDEREAIAVEILEKIVERTQKGIDKDGDKFPKYSSAYKNSMNYKIAGKSGKVDLTLSGDMLADLQLLSHKSGEITIGYENGTESNSKAEGNIKGTYGKKIGDPSKVRDFLGVRDNELKSVLSNYPIEDRSARLERLGYIKDLLQGAEEITAKVVLDGIEN